MPTHSLVGYNFGLRKTHETDPTDFWPLHNLHAHNADLPDDEIVDSFDTLLGDLSGQVQKDVDNEKAYIVEDYKADSNVVEALVAAGNYGYEAQLRDVASGNTTYQKSENEAEFMRYYMLFWIPQTTQNAHHNNGREAILIFQNVSGGGIKTLFHTEIKEHLLSGTDETVLKMDPIVSQDVLSKIIDSKGVKRVTFNLKESARNTDQQMKLVNNISSQDVGEQHIVWRAERGGHLGRFKKKAKQLKNSGSNFATLAGGETEDMKVKIERGDGRQESFSVIDDLPQMRVHLSPDQSDLDHGLPKTQYLCDEACYTINRQYNSSVVKTLNQTTVL